MDANAHINSKVGAREPTWVGRLAGSAQHALQTQEILLSWTHGTWVPVVLPAAKLSELH